MTTELSNEQGSLLFQLHENTPSKLFWVESSYLSPKLEWYQNGVPGMKSVALTFDSREQRNEFITGLEYEGYVPSGSLLGFVFHHNPYHIPNGVWKKIME